MRCMKQKFSLSYLFLPFVVVVALVLVIATDVTLCIQLCLVTLEVVHWCMTVNDK